ncbi:MAG: alpha/beta fold hydrolase [Gemmatimonadota bacterium]|jgi:pimeloyl-ACP methyl ester carboxylesterase
MLRRIVIGVGVLIALLVALPVLSALISLDWSRAHTKATEALPLFTESPGDGLVRIPAGGLEFRARVAGLRSDGPNVVLLHGFPATSAMWVPVIDALAAQGYRVVAYDQRGYSPGARPEGVAAYTVDHTSDDVVAVADAVGFDRFHLIGHDWGCVAGWVTAVRHPERIVSFGGISIPHVGAMIDELSGELPTYIRIFNLPGVSELTLSAAGFRQLGRALPDVEPLHAEAVAALSEPGALTGALNWYRAIPRSFGSLEVDSYAVDLPVLFVWGEREPWVTPERLDAQRALMRGPYEEVELDAGHWVVEDQPDAVVGHLLAHLARAEAG